MMLSGTSKLAGIMGWPVAHSRSPRLHGHWLERYGIDGAYLPLPVRAEGFAAAVRSLADLGFRGVNVTIPHKQAALAACDQVEDSARRIGAVNTIVMEDGRLLGSNTDGVGFLENLRQVQPDWDPTAGPAVVLGAGGAARAVVAALLEAGAPELRLLNRTQVRSEALAAQWGARVTAYPWAERDSRLAEAAVLVNTTSLGLVGHEPLEIDLAGLPADALVTDIVYVPLETPLLAAAQARGNPVVDGLGMLLHQARPGFSAWFGIDPEVTEELRAFVLAGP
jgi:shikimate dehydrogenase